MVPAEASAPEEEVGLDGVVPAGEEELGGNVAAGEDEGVAVGGGAGGDEGLDGLQLEGLRVGVRAPEEDDELLRRRRPGDRPAGLVLREGGNVRVGVVVRAGAWVHHRPDLGNWGWQRDPEP